MTTAMKKFVLSGGRAIDPASSTDESRDILVEDGKIAAVDKPGSFSKSSDTSVVDVSGKLVVPGLLDIHVHLREPGQEWKETILTGSQAAVAGGFTTVCCMPNTVPSNDNASITEFIVKQGRAANLCRVFPIGAITKDRSSKELAPFLEMREAGCVAFSDDGAPVSDAGLMRRALEYNLMMGTVLTVHEEEKQLSEGFVMNESARSLRMGLRGMPGAAEEIMISRDIELARLTGGRVHFCHVSTARGVTLIRRAKEDGIPVTAETGPHYFTLDDSAVEDYNTQAKVSMPLRTPADGEALLAGLRDGVIDCIASDHAPHESDSKMCEFDRASFGFIGLQTMLPLTLAQVRSGKLSLARAIDALTFSAARCLNLRKPELKAGAVADLTVIDLEKKITLAPGLIRSKSKNTPFMGWELTGNAVMTFVDGRKVYEFGETVG